MNAAGRGAYGADNHVVDFILGITYEIWEQRGIDLIHQYYGSNAPVYALSGIVRGAAQVVEGTRQVLDAYPDRILLGDDVIWSGNRRDGYYSSHRIVSMMTNTGATQFGPATGKRVRILSIADCVVEDGLITLEWLMRDYYALVKQLGFDPNHAAQVIADHRDADTLNWIAAERDRIERHGVVRERAALPSPADDRHGFARAVITALWTSGDNAVLDRAYAPYASLHRSAERLFSGREAIEAHYGDLRAAIDATGVAVDNVAVQPFSDNGVDMAVRWTVTGRHRGEFIGHAATGKDVFVMGATHWRLIGNCIAAEWTVFDGLGVLAQMI